MIAGIAGIVVFMGLIQLVIAFILKVRGGGDHILCPSNQSMKPTAPLRGNFSVFAMTPCRGLSLSR
jgi:hypothetical protein